WVNTVAWSPDGNFLASGAGYTPPNQSTRTSLDNSVQVWEAATGNRRFTYNGHADAVTTVAWSPDGQRLASGRWDTTAQLWSAQDGSGLATYRGHSNHVWAVAWSPRNGQRLASGSKDETAQVWDATTRATLLTYRGHVGGKPTGVVFSLAWAPDGKHIATG